MRSTAPCHPTRARSTSTASTVAPSRAPRRVQLESPHVRRFHEAILRQAQLPLLHLCGSCSRCRHRGVMVVMMVVMSGKGAHTQGRELRAGVQQHLPQSVGGWCQSPVLDQDDGDFTIEIRYSRTIKCILSKEITPDHRSLSMANVLSSMQWDHYHSKWPFSVGEVGSDSPQMNDRAADAPLSPLLLSLSCCSGWWEEGCQRRRGPGRRGRGNNTNKQKKKKSDNTQRGGSSSQASQPSSARESADPQLLIVRTTLFLLPVAFVCFSIQ